MPSKGGVGYDNKQNCLEEFLVESLWWRITWKQPIFFRGSTIGNCKTVEKSFYYNSVLRSHCSKGASLKPLSDNYVNESTLTARTLQLSLVSLFFVSCIPFFPAFQVMNRYRVSSPMKFLFLNTLYYHIWESVWQQNNIFRRHVLI